MDKAAIIKKLRAKGSQKVQERMNEKMGESYCASYIQKNMDTYKATFDVALGWLEQELSDIN